MDETDEIDDINSTIYRFNGEIKIKNISYIKGMGLVGCDRSMLHTSKHIKRKETLET
jgi:hypothetical protein